MNRWTAVLLTLATLLSAAAPCAAQGLAAPGSRGQMLYANHCVACHSTQMHWRDKRLVTDWDSLKTQVRRWQATAQLNWSEADIDDVARYLNDSIYRLSGGGKLAGFPSPQPPRR
ncbi:MAG: cytochrome c [Rubrivivax sp.]|jgi:mono/diheme cytochrome c family protein|nr:cytochrome c [Rubrivivax sp.]MBK7263434.1 cytochrome c [Rubrivivax sp.]MBK8525539.1 cytochrome c [Rubrivivax sp.]